MKKLCACFLLCLGVVGCSGPAGITRFIDRYAFHYMGTTPMTGVEPVTLKEIGIDNGELLGREVIVKGAVVETSQHATYLILSDESARLLVVLTGLDQLVTDQDGLPGEVIVLGTVESGKKGLPFLKATSIHTVQESAQG